MKAFRSSGYVGIDRHIGRSGLEDPEQADQHRGRPVDADCDELAWIYPEALQMSRELCRPHFECSVCQAGVACDNRDALRPASGSVGQKLVKTAIRKVLCGGVPVFEQALPFVLGEKAEAPKGERRLCFRRLE